MDDSEAEESSYSQILREEKKAKRLEKNNPKDYGDRCDESSSSS